MTLLNVHLFQSLGSRPFKRSPDKSEGSSDVLTDGFVPLEAAAALPAVAGFQEKVGPDGDTCEGAELIVCQLCPRVEDGSDSSCTSNLELNFPQSAVCL